MWAVPKGWQLERKGDVMMLASQTGRIVVQEGLRPVAEIDALVAAVRLADFTLASVQRLVTCEGERGIVASGVAGNATIELGFVLLDDSYVRVVGHGEGVAPVVRELVTSTRAYLAAPRRRRFWYRTPPGWRRIESPGGIETCLAPDYPAHRASISIPRALPIAAREQFSVVRELLGTDEEPPPPTPIKTQTGLTGMRWMREQISDDGVALEVMVVALSDGTYDYFARAIMPHGEQHVFADFIESIEPVPAPPAASSAVAPLMFLVT